MKSAATGHYDQVTELSRFIYNHMTPKRHSAIKKYG